MKEIGAGLVFLAGFLLSQYLMNPALDQIRLMEEGELLFRILESEIRNRKIPLPELFSQLSEKTESVWSNFFYDLSKELQKNGDLDFIDSFEHLLVAYTSPVLSDEERQIFLNIGRNLLSDDLTFQRNSMEAFSEQLRHCLEEKKKAYQNQKKVLRAVCLSMSALIVIILI